MSTEENSRHLEQQNSSERPMGLFIDSSPSMAQTWKNEFEIMGIDGIAREPDQTMREMRQQLEEVNLSTIDFVIADQFLTADRSVREITAGIVEEVRKQNPSAWIIETSGTLTEQYYESNVCLGKYSLLLTMIELAEIHEDLSVRIKDDQRLANTTLLRWMTITNPAFAEARYIEDLEDEELESSFISLTQQEFFPELLQEIKINQDQFKSFFSRTPEETKKFILHDSWNIIGHMILGSNPDFYGVSFTMLQTRLSMVREDSANS